MVMITFLINVLNPFDGLSYPTFKVSETSTIEEFIDKLLDQKNSRGVPVSRVINLHATDSFITQDGRRKPAFPQIHDVRFVIPTIPQKRENDLHTYPKDETLKNAMLTMGKDQAGTVRVLVIVKPKPYYDDRALQKRVRNLNT